MVETKKPSLGTWALELSLLPNPSKEFQVLRRRSAICIELTRPEKRNTLTARMVKDLKDLYKRVAEDTSIFRIYLTGQGRVFSAGMDLSASGDATTPNEEAHLAHMNQFRALLDAIERAPQVTIALINGPCYGGGNGLAFANDIRVCTQDSTFNLPEVRLGLEPCAISPPLAREWGIPLFRSAMLTGRPVSAAQLQNVGAIYDVATNREALYGGTLETLESTLGGCAPGASTACKELARVAWTNPGSVVQDEVVRRRYLEMMAPSPEAQFGIEQFRKGVRSVDWTEMGRGRRESRL